MFTYRHNRRWHGMTLPLTFAALLVASSPLNSPADEGTKAPPAQQQNETTGGTDEKASDHHADQSSPELGVVVGDCPGQGVCVMDTAMGSPADRVGLQPGDYILAVNDQMVSSPAELKQKIASLHGSDTIDVSVWRRGKTFTKQVALASKADELPQSHRSWLGVMLTDDTDEHTGVVIKQVHRKSPAARAGLRDGDHIHKVNGEDVKSIDAFVDKVSEFAPGTELTLTIERDGKEQQMDVELGQVSDAPIKWFRRSWRMPLDAEDLARPPLQPLPGADVMDEMIDEMREQIRSLQRDVEQLKRPTPPPVDSDIKGLKDPVPATPEIDDVSRLDNAIRLVQYDSSRPFPPNISNDWTGSRYRNQYDGNRVYRYRPPYGPVYRDYFNPYGNYRYYQHRGRPYYYGRSYPYGFRGGVQIGPNFGVYW